MSPRHVPASAAELQRVGLFGSLSGETIAKLGRADGAGAGSLPARAIVTEGEYTDRFYVLLSGLAGVTQEGRGTRAVVRPGETFGEVAPLMRDGADGDGHRDDGVRRRELRPGDVRRAAAAALRRRLKLCQNGVRERGPGDLCPLAELPRRQRHAGDAPVGVDPDERAAAAEMAVRSR